LLEGKLVNLRAMKKEDIPLLVDWWSNPKFWGQYFSPLQRFETKLEKWFEDNPQFWQFIIEKKDETKIGCISYYNIHAPYTTFLEMGYAILPEERGKGYCTEAVKIIVDYLFLSADVACIQATTDVGNIASQKVLEKSGFQKEGILRKRVFNNGRWENSVIYSILREEWKEPKILTKTA
jgi:RimJ/RimL family protein N-acetyltransferase